MYMMKKNKKVINNNIPIIRNIVYKRINDMLKDIKEITPEMSDFFKDKVDINMKNAINKILNDYKTQ
jgi:predicted nucleotidyltransferase